MVVAESPYRKQSYTFWEQAQEELAKGDLRQASEKGWGAATQMLKAVAVLYGMKHHGHRELFRVVSSLDNDRLTVNFSMADSLHSNFYEGWMDEKLVRRHLLGVGELIRLLDNDILAAGQSS